MIVDSISLEVMSYSCSFLDILPNRFLQVGQPIAKISNAIADKITKINSLKSGFNLLDNDEENPEDNWLKKTQRFILPGYSSKILQSSKPAYFKFDNWLSFACPEAHQRRLKF